jgi:hypothetical protein
MKFISQLFTYLKSLWAILAIAVAALPAMNYFSDVSVVPRNSQIAGLYGALPSLSAAFALLLLTTFRNELKDLKYARKVALIFVVGGFFSTFSFIGIKTFMVDLESSERLISHDGTTRKWVDKSRGVIQTKTFDLKSASDEAVSENLRGDPWDIAGLATYTLAIAGFSIGFCALGIYSFMNEEVEVIPPDNH